MPHLTLKIGTVGPDPLYQDGDIVCAFNDRRIKCCHAEMICHPRKEGFNSHGLRIPKGLAQLFYDNTHQYKFERLNKVEMKRINLITGEEEIFGATPNTNGEYIDVPLFISKRISNKNHVIFGQEGREYWYGGKKDFSTKNIGKVWINIEDRTVFKESDHKRWPFSHREKKAFLIIDTDDFGDVVSDLLVSREDKNGKMIRKRKNMVDWKNLDLGVSRADIRNPGKEISISKSFNRLKIVHSKKPL